MAERLQNDVTISNSRARGAKSHCESNVVDWDARPINAGSTATLLRDPDWPFAQAEKSTERIESNRRLFRILERFRPIILLSLAPALRISEYLQINLLNPDPSFQPTK